jgi:transcriptional regulator with XRE-family HTH domain
VTEQPTNRLGRYLKGVREGRGLSLRECARQLGVSHVFLAEVERGTRSFGGGIERWTTIAAVLPIDLRLVEQLLAADETESIGRLVREALPPGWSYALVVAEGPVGARGFFSTVGTPGSTLELLRDAVVRLEGA